MKIPELLAPAGSLEKLKTAVDFGADAVYLGGAKLNLRAFADNFSDDELIKGIEYAHSHNKKVYVTLNVFPHNEDMNEVPLYLKKLYDMKVDAIIVSDPGIIMTAKEIVPELELHISTQANNVNYKSALFWHNEGVKRIILARELTLSEISFIRSKLPDTCELEAFVHGSMCVSYSGRCFLSNYMTGRDSNRGQCAQPCRYKYYLMEERRPNQYFPVFEDDKGAYIMNSKDLCMIEHIPELIESGLSSLKIEGRMKSSYYVAAVVKAYRMALDSYAENPEKYVFNKKWLDLLNKVSHRKYYTGFYFNEEDKQYTESSAYIRDYDIVGIVKDYNNETKICTVEQRNKLYCNDTVEILSSKNDTSCVKIQDMKDEDGNIIKNAPCAQMIFTFKSSIPLYKDDMLVKQKEN